MDYLRLHLCVIAFSFPGGSPPVFHELKITCSNAVEYYIRPKDPNTIEGGPCIHFYEQHQLLDDKRLQGVPGGDGEVFKPPLKLQLLILDQTYVIAERFEVEETLLSVRAHHGGSSTAR